MNLGRFFVYKKTVETLKYSENPSYLTNKQNIFIFAAGCPNKTIRFSYFTACLTKEWHLKLTTTSAHPVPKVTGYGTCSCCGTLPRPC